MSNSKTLRIYIVYSTSIPSLLCDLLLYFIFMSFRILCIDNIIVHGYLSFIMTGMHREWICVDRDKYP